MTSNERKIINFLGETKEKTHVRLVAQKTNLSSDYARLLCRSLARSSHIKFENDLCHLLKKEHSQFEKNNLSVAEEPAVVTATVAPLMDEPTYMPLTDDPEDEDENQEDGANATDEDLDQPANEDEPEDEVEEKNRPPEETGKETKAEQAEVEEKKIEELVEETGVEKIETGAKEEKITLQQTTISEAAPQIVVASVMTAPGLVETTINRFFQGFGTGFKKATKWISKTQRRNRVSSKRRKKTRKSKK